MKIIILLATLAFSVLSQAKTPIETSLLKISLEDDVALEKAIGSIVSGSDASEAFDNVKNGSISIALLNDYNFSDRNSEDLSKVNDDIGKTHGLEIAFSKNLTSELFKGEYFLTVSYKSTLYTNSDRPSEFQNDYRDVVYLTDDNYYQADVYFKEENLFDFIISKTKQKNALFYSAGIGFQEINAEDADRGFFISSLSQQAWLHGRINSGSEYGTIREYNYMPQENASKKGIHIKGEVGQDYTFLEDQSSRTFVRALTNSQVGMVSELNYIGAQVGFFHDRKFESFPSLRLQAGVDFKRYKDSNYINNFLEMSLTGDKFNFSLRYELPQTNEYINALPANFPGRELEINQPKKEGVLWLTLKAHF